MLSHPEKGRLLVIITLPRSALRTRLHKGAFVVATGISSLCSEGTSFWRLIRTRTNDDVVRIYP